MTLRKTADVTFNPNSDFFRVDRGIEWGIKVTHMPEFKFVSVFYRTVGNLQWQASALSNMDWHGEVGSMTLNEWFTQKILPVLQQWLNDTFTKSSGNQDPLLEMSLQLDTLLLKNLKVIENADGTLTATVA